MYRPPGLSHIGFPAVKRCANTTIRYYVLYSIYHCNTVLCIAYILLQYIIMYFQVSMAIVMFGVTRQERTAGITAVAFAISNQLKNNGSAMNCNTCLVFLVLSLQSIKYILF